MSAARSPVVGLASFVVTAAAIAACGAPLA
jgi:hypothetical protein